jgi:hypothetical protein
MGLRPAFGIASVAGRGSREGLVFGQQASCAAGPRACNELAKGWGRLHQALLQSCNGNAHALHMLHGDSGSRCCGRVLGVSKGCQQDWVPSHSLQITYVASNVHVVCGLSVSPDHSIRREMRLHARGLPCEDNSAIRRRIREVGPGNGRGVAHYLWALDEMFERFCGLKGS